MRNVAHVDGAKAVHLGAGVVADGFDFDALLRVQSHVHSDHMDRFDDSKGNGRIVCSEATRKLLIAIRPNEPDLQYRSNLIGLPYDKPYSFVEPGGGTATVRLLPAGHMVGASQVEVVASDGYRTGYTGDFSWPLSDVLDVDELVIDATYGSPDYNRRRYTTQQADERFVEEALRRCGQGPLIVYAHRGTLQRAIALLDDAVSVPLLGSPAQRAESVVHAEFGYIQAELRDPTSAEGRAAIDAGRYILFVGTGDPQRELKPNEHKIKLSASVTQMDDPYLEITPRYCRIALSDHADFDETLEYIATAKPRAVVTDAARNLSHAVSLAETVTARLGIPARPSPEPVVV